MHYGVLQVAMQLLYHSPQDAAGVGLLICKIVEDEGGVNLVTVIVDAGSPGPLSVTST